MVCIRRRHILEITRRGFLAGLGVLVVAATPNGAVAAASPTGHLNAFVAIAKDGSVTLGIPSSEMGQGIITAMPQLIADELDITFDSITVRHAPVEPEFRSQISISKEQVTGGSASIRYWNEPLRQAGASARMMLITAAARRWGVDPHTCTTDLGTVNHPSGKSATYGDLVLEASQLSAPKAPIRRPQKIAGTSQARQDLLPKVTGEAEFGIDVRLPNMLRASLRACPHFGGTVESVDDTAALAVKGVKKVLVFEEFVAVVAIGWWQAEKGARALKITWAGGHRDLDTAGIDAAFDASLSKNGRKGLKRGNAKAALEGGGIKASYSVPYLDHAPLEPLNCTVHIDKDVCRVWTGSQVQTRTTKVAKKLSGREVELVTPFLGGGFGRRGNIDFTEQAVKIALELDQPVQLIWSREQCTQHGFYRPGAKTQMRGSVKDGRIEALHTHLASDNILYRYVPDLMVDLITFAATFPLEGMRTKECPYQIDHHLVEYTRTELPIPIGFWRSVGHSHNGFFLESFIDELAHAAGADPVAFRLAHIEDERYRRVLKTVAEKAGWGKAPKGIHQGVAIMESYGSVCAEVAEVEMLDGLPKVRRVVVVVDCGEVINPDIVQAQLMSAVIFGLSTSMGEKLDFAEGAVVQSNFHDYPLLRMPEAPLVEGYTIAGPNSPIGGIGEVAVPPLAPAVCNAIFAASGKRIRNLPILENLG